MSPLLAYIRNVAGICEKLFAEGHPSLQKNSKSDGQHRRFSAHRSCCCVVAWPLILIQVFCVTPCFAEQGNQDRELQIGLSATITKNVYDINEPVLLAYAISNYSDMPLYITEPRTSMLRVQIKDADGRIVTSEAIPSPRMPSSRNIVMINGKRKYVRPVVKIDGWDTLIATIPDVIERHRAFMQPGVYKLTPTFSKSVYGEDSVFRREGFPGKLWVDPGNREMVQTIIVEAAPITFEICDEDSDAQKEQANPARPDAGPAGTVANSRFSWETFVGGTGLGAILASALFLLARRHEST